MSTTSITASVTDSITRAAAALALAAALAGCGGGSTPRILITQIAPGDQCPSGGQLITVGNQSTVICNGTTGQDGASGATGATGPGGTPGHRGPNTLVKSTPLPVGDASCPAGGLRLESGLDNGAGGGIAFDGVLQPGEVLTTQNLCNGSSIANPGSLTPPGGREGTSTIKTLGGAGLSASGGRGGNVVLSLNRGSGGGHVKLFRTGRADASFTFPAVPAPALGSAPAIVSQSVSIPRDVSLQPNLPSGTLFTSGESLYSSNGPGNTATQMVALQILAGATATFAVASNQQIAVSLSSSCVNAGTIQTAPVVNGGGRAGGLTLSCGDYFGDAGSALQAIGAAGTTGSAGSSGGNLTVATRSFWNKGSFDASGGAGAPGGAAGAISIVSDSIAFNTGNLTARGGDSTSATTAAGTGGAISLVSNSDLNNSGRIDSSGGSGGATGGAAGTVQVSVSPSNQQSRGHFQSLGSAIGSLRNSGDIAALGGDAAAGCATDCGGGNGARIQLWSENGLLANTGSLSSRGGAGAAGRGGNGANLLVAVFSDDSAVNNRIIPGGSLTMSGTVDLSGGSGASGGDAGSAAFDLDTRQQPNGQELILYGYPAIHTDGAGGVSSGGDGGRIFLNNNLASFPPSTAVEGGSVISYADLTTTGGAASAGAPGNGGSIDFSTQSNTYVPGPAFELALNAGIIIANGGSGTGGSRAGGVSLYGRNGARSTGTITAHSGSSANCVSFDQNQVSFTAENGPVANFASIDVSAGSCTSDGTGVVGGDIFFTGIGVLNAAPLMAMGGAAGATAGTGGTGGSINLSSYAGLSENRVAAPAGLNVRGGAAKTPGRTGLVQIDGRIVTESWTH
jgi:hypothetical protein